jgi:hypothetical protein
MSTKTNFKRIALVAVAALGLGVLSSVPSQAAADSFSITSSAGTATTSLSDSTTAGSYAANFIARAAGDSVSVTIKLKSDPGAGTAYPVLQFNDTTSARVDTDTVWHAAQTWVGSNPTGRADSITSMTTNQPTRYYIFNSDTTAANTRIGAGFKVYLNGTVAVGTYVATVVLDTGERNASTGAATFRETDVTITVSAPSTASVLSSSYAYMVTGTATAAGTVGATNVDSSIAAVATSSATARAAIRISLGNATSTALESVTVTTTAGTVGTSTSKGRSIVMAYPVSGTLDVFVYSDGTAGKATITISTASITFPTKTVDFYSATAAKITAASYASVIGASGIGVYGLEYDSLNNSFGAGIDVYAYSSDTSVISNYGTACTYVSAAAPFATCTLTGLKDGTANITLRDASTVALSTVASNAVAVRVSLKPAATVKISTDKATYSAGDKATIWYTVYDADGKVMPAGTYTNLWTSSGVTVDKGVTKISTADLLTASVTTSGNPIASSAAPVVSTDPVAQFVYNVPVGGGTFTISGTGGSSLPVAGQVKVSTSATVTDNAAAALAAVTALATTVASLKTLITTLTNLVLKIQKKVKA